jgi:hypothetical protein
VATAKPPLTRAQRVARAKHAAAVRNDSVTQAAKLVGAWPELSEDQKAQIAYMLRPVIKNYRPIDRGAA